MIDKLYMRSEHSVMSDSVRFYLGNDEKIVKSISYQERKPYCCYKPSFEISRNQIQCLMDDLWRSGIRPTENKMESGTLNAMEGHLSDMRTIAFHKLKIGDK